MRTSHFSFPRGSPRARHPQRTIQALDTLASRSVNCQRLRAMNTCCAAVRRGREAARHPHPGVTSPPRGSRQPASSMTFYLYSPAIWPAADVGAVLARPSSRTSPCLKSSALPVFPTCPSLRSLGSPSPGSPGRRYRAVAESPRPGGRRRWVSCGGARLPRPYRSVDHPTGGRPWGLRRSVRAVSSMPGVTGLPAGPHVRAAP